MSENRERTIEVTPTKEPLITLLSTEEGVQIFDYKWRIYLGPLVPETGLLVIFGLSFKQFNPSSVDCLKTIKQGDLINTSVIVENDEAMKAWKPPKEFYPGDSYSNTFQVVMVTEDVAGYPIIVCEEAN